MKLWTAPRIWPDGECFILGGGPSLKNVDVDRLRGHRVIAVNNAYRLGDWIDVVFFGDKDYLEKPVEDGSDVTHRDLLLKFGGLKITKRLEYLREPGVRVMECDYIERGVSIERGKLRWNLSSGACAITLAVQFGVKRIVLLGFDMHRAPNGEKNWHGYHVGSDRGFTPYPGFLSVFPKMAEDLKSLGVEVINATQGSSLRVFPMMSLDDVLVGERLTEGTPC